jgi:hypothetical protein
LASQTHPSLPNKTAQVLRCLWAKAPAIPLVLHLSEEGELGGVAAASSLCWGHNQEVSREGDMKKTPLTLQRALSHQRVGEHRTEGIEMLR